MHPELWLVSKLAVVIFVPFSIGYKLMKTLKLHVCMRVNCICIFTRPGICLNQRGNCITADPECPKMRILHLGISNISRNVEPPLLPNSFPMLPLSRVGDAWRRVVLSPQTSTRIDATACLRYRPMESRHAGCWTLHN